MLKLFSGNRTIVLLLLPVFLFLFHFLNYSNRFYLSSDLDIGLWTIFFTGIKINTSWVAGGLVLLNSVILNVVFNRSNFFDRITYLIAPCYVVLMSFFECSYVLSGVIISHTLLALMLRQLFDMTQNDIRKSGVFNTLFLAGLMATFLPVFLPAIPIFFVLIRLIRPLEVRDVFIGIIAASLPLIYYFSANYIFDYVPSLQAALPEKKDVLKGDSFALLGIISVSSIIGFSTFLGQWNESSIRTKRQFQMLLCLFLCFLLFSVVYLLSFQHIDFFSLLLLPLCLLLPFAFRSQSLGMSTSGAFYLLLTFSVMKFFIF